MVVSVTGLPIVSGLHLYSILKMTKDQFSTQKNILKNHLTLASELLLNISVVCALLLLLLLPVFDDGEGLQHEISISCLIRAVPSVIMET